MIPLRDNIPSRRFPIMTVILIVVNVGIFLYEVTLSQPERESFIRTFGMVPYRFIGSGPEIPEASLGTFQPLVTAIFLHGSWLHILGNMLFLWVFGDNIEDLTGSWRFLAMYTLAGVAGNVAHAFANPASTVPAIGASGAVAGVLGAYLLNFPHARVITLVPIGIFLTTVEIPAMFFLLIWFGIQLISGVASLGVAATGGVAWWAHIGGFVAGAILVTFFRERRYIR